MTIQPKLDEILTRSWEIFTRKFKTILIITLIIYIPLNFVLESLPADDTAEGMMMYFRAMQLLEGLFGILAAIAIAFITKSALENKAISWQESLKLAINKWLKAIGTNLLAGILLLGLFILLIIPGIIFSIYWYFILYVVIFTDKWGLEALKASKELVQNRWWKTFGYAILFGALALIVGAIASLPIYFMADNIFLYVAGDLIIDIAIAFFSVLSVVWYFAWESSKIKSPNKSESK
ncbi:hypothetical protein GF391_01385 [Candidatus Uhrbacteria bacterium]|nr:hypothetical protein [Candidatus Uhrbacteria bacterium]